MSIKVYNPGFTHVIVLPWTAKAFGKTESYPRLSKVLAKADIDIQEVTLVMPVDTEELTKWMEEQVRIDAVLVMGKEAQRTYFGKNRASQAGEVVIHQLTTKHSSFYVYFTHSIQEVRLNQEHKYNFMNHLQYFKLLMTNDTLKLQAKYNFTFKAGKKAFVKELMDKSDITSFDIESTGLDFKKEMTMVGFAGRLTNGELWTGLWVPMESPYVTKGGVHEDMADVHMREIISELPNAVAHHSRFDNMFLHTHLNVTAPLMLDTMNLAHYENDLQSKKLKHLLRAKLGAEPYEMDIEYAPDDPTRLMEYCRKDALGTLLLAEWYKENQFPVQNAGGSHYLTKVGDKTITHIMAVERVLQSIERRGVYLDIKSALRLKTTIGVELEACEGELRSFASTHGMADINFSSPAQLKTLLYDKMKYPPIYKDEVNLELEDEYAEDEEYSESDHTLTTNAAALKKMAHGGSVFCAELLKYREKKKIIDGFLTPWMDMVDKDSRLHPAYHATRARTCRLSSSGPNLQQVSRDPQVRNLIAAPEGKVFIEADYSQIELRVAAVVGKVESMKRIYRSGGDIHVNTGKAIANLQGVTWDVLSKDMQKQYRQRAKAVNFGFLYGMSAKGFMEYAAQSYDLYVTLKEAEAFRDLYFRLYPELKEWHERSNAESMGTGVAKIATGRVRHIPNVASYNGYLQGKARRQGLNTPIQGLASEFTLLSMVELNERLDTTQIVGQCHDAIFFETTNEQAPYACAIINRWMTDLGYKKLITDNINFDIPLEVEIKVGKCRGDPLAKVWKKDA